MSALQQVLLGGAPPPLSTPSSISSIWDWWEPSRESYANNDPIGTLTGQFASKTFTASGSNRPTFKTGQLNGLAVADCNTNHMGGPNASALTAGHIWLVMKAANDPGASGVNTPWEIGTSGQAELFTFSDGDIYSGAGSNTRRDCGNPTPSFTSWRVVEVITTSSEWTLNVDGSTLKTVASNTVSFSTVITLCGNNTGGATLTGQIAGLYIFNAKLGTTDRNTMVTYLNNRFGLSIV